MPFARNQEITIPAADRVLFSAGFDMSDAAFYIFKYKNAGAVPKNMAPVILRTAVDMIFGVRICFAEMDDVVRGFGGGGGKILKDRPLLAGHFYHYYDLLCFSGESANLYLYNQNTRKIGFVNIIMKKVFDAGKTRPAAVLFYKP